MDREELLPRLSEDAKQYADRVMDMYGAPFAREMGIEIVSVSLDRIVCEMELRPEMMNSMGRGHGAAIYALMDHAFAIASNLMFDATGQSTEVKFYRPATGKLTAVAIPINRSRSFGIFDVRAFSEEGKLIASATCTSFRIERQSSR